jgi:adenine-specific DNA-methyltransferase
MNKSLGQYFTKDIDLKKKVYEFILNKPDKILEPSIGRGDLVDYVISTSPDPPEFVMYEIDDTIELLDSIDKEKVIYQDFMSADFRNLRFPTFDTIIGNPPYVRTKSGNLYIDFIDKCVNLLNKNGELIFIVPSDFMKLTSASKLLTRMMKIGNFSHIYHPHNEHLFEGATIDVLIFRYVLGCPISNDVLYNDIPMKVVNNDGMITFANDSNKSYVKLVKDYFDVYVGMVSGKEEAFKNTEYGNLDVLTGENKIEKYIYIVDSKDESIQQLLPYKNDLLNRGIRKFSESNWYEWGAPRNIGVMNANIGKDCIYVYNLTRKEKIAFLGKCMPFGGNLLMLLPKHSMPRESKIPKHLIDIVSYINSDSFKKDFMFSGRFKIGQRQLSLAVLGPLMS